MKVNPLLNKTTSSIINTNEPLQPGRILKGSVLHLYPNQKARIQLGNREMVAQLKASLSIGTSYHFQVQSITNQSIHLKVLGKELKGDERDNASQLLQQLGIKSSRANASFVQRLLTENIPFNREELTAALHILSEKPDKANSYLLLREMLMKRLPINEAIFQSLYQLRNSSINEQVDLFMKATSQNSNQSPQLVASLREKLQSFLNVQANDSVKDSIFNLLKSSLINLGHGYDSQLLQGKSTESNQSLKAMLLLLQQQTMGSLNETTKQFIELINGLQLNSVRETPEFIYTQIQLPGLPFQMKQDIHIKFEGKKNEKGEINPSHCRIIFFLELSHLNETVIDMNIQNRHVSITLFNNTPQLDELITTIKPLLKTGLEQEDYHLSTITVQSYNSHQQGERSFHTIDSEINQGVDFRV
ncbi:hypothetical protein [Ornithinibacillus halophilus]|uniref:Hook-length control protein FliK n=1 Tax=Ornithinibacillus halophilus TaxID=930117 RepID=A0A1M5C985_9BACI|nr:hypothetical protein [Ornithinibacillus halophilus]SHF51167.1 hypothetical protein SAMN05216225_1001125 [Ornithinibacillus halophilus]